MTFSNFKGKTSLLRCVVGIRKPNSGNISVFGKEPGQPGSGIPGPGLGYMPQEIALFLDFSIYETFRYFGKLYQINESKVSERTDELIALLNLPNKNKFIKNLSGGQKRRVSLAVALIHSPPLLILDEPTVGVDPVLRQSIWDHMEMLCNSLGLTIIITTQYIEEAKSADIVSFMRNGKLLMEKNPIQLLQEMNLPSLESVFLKLCQLETNDRALENVSIGSSGHENNQIEVRVKPEINVSANEKYIYLEDISDNTNRVDINYNHNLNDNNTAFTPKTESLLTANNSKFAFLRRISALNWKNITGIRRNLSMLIIQFLMPSFQCLLNFTCLGPDPYDLPIAVYNNDRPSIVSDLFLRTLSNRTMNLNYYDSLEEALQRVRDGFAWAAITFSANYTRLMQEVAYSEDIESVPKIGLYIDTTNYVISYTIQKEMYLTYNKTINLMADLIGSNISSSDIQNPISIDGIIYGKESPEMTEFMAPGIQLSSF
jgi:ABC-type multidrug transport system ATPase subunit